MRKHALLQDGLGETETARRSGIEILDGEGEATGGRKNLRRERPRTNQSQARHGRGHTFSEDGPNLFATRRILSRLLFQWGRVHRATARGGRERVGGWQR